jgi:hypothetical protein
MEPGAVTLRPMSMSRLLVTPRLLMTVATLVVVTSCGSTASPQGSPEGAEASETTPDDASRRMCSQADEEAKLLGAWPTTVELVRTRSGGPAPGHSPASAPWADLPDGAEAAWCTFRRSTTYVVSAATTNAPLVDFMTSDTPVGEVPDGPAIP